MILSNLSVRRPVLMTMVIMTFVVLGLFSYFRLVVDLMPEVDLPFVTVTTVYPGAGPEEIETQISKKIEDAVSNISNVKRINSTSRENLSLVFIEFNVGVNVDLAAIDVKDEVDKIRRNLPEDAEDPMVVKFDINALPIMNLAVSGARPLHEIYELADNLIRDELAKIDGVSSIEIVGGRKREILISLEREKLKAYGLSIMDVIQAVAVENLSVPAGRITESWQEYTVRTVGEFEHVTDLARMQVRLKNGSVIELQELGGVLDTFEEVRDLARFEGKNAVGITIQKRGDANTIQAAEGIRRAIARLGSRLPEDVEINIARDRSTFIESSVADVIQNIFLGIVLTAILLYLFSHSWRATVVAAVAMPTSIIATFLLIDFAGFTVNVMTLMALGVSIGTLVTNALVVLENITRHIEAGEAPASAAEIGADEIAVAVIASTATNIVVFTPIAFMSGIVGQFFKQFGLTVVFATLFSLIVSFTLTPMMSAKLLRREKGGNGHGRHPLRHFSAIWERGYEGLVRDYTRLLGWCLGHPMRTTAMVLVVFAFSLYLFRYIGGEFFPSSDQGTISVEIEMPPGTPLEQTDRTLRRVETVVSALPETETVYSTVGGGNTGVETASVLVQLVDAEKREKDITTLLNELRPMLADIPGAEVRLARPGVGGGGRSDIVIEVTGPEMSMLRKVAEQVRSIVSETDGLVDVESSYKPARPELVFVPDRRKMADLDVPTGKVASVLRACFEGEDASVYRELGEEYDIRVKLSEANRNVLSDVDLITIQAGGRHIPLDQLGRLEMRPGTSEILRKNKERLIEVSANIGKGSQTEAIGSIRVRTDQLSLPPGYRIYFGGQEEDRVETFAQILQALLLAIILTYMVLAAIMESYVHPFTIMLTLPLGLIGVAFSLFLAAKTLNLFSMMAMVMLVGIVVNNAILILDYTQQLRTQGMGIREALLEAAPIRLRPIVMANLAIALSMIPQALGGAGSEFRVAMAVVTIGGVLLSAVFTLFFIPVIYVFMDRFARQPQ